MKKIAAIFLLVWSVSVSAQHDPLFGQYMFNPQLINPAYVGSHQGINASVFGREQYSGFRGAPIVNSFAIDAPLHYGQLGAGLSALNEFIAGVNLFSLYGTASYKLNALRGVLSFGIEGGLQQHAISFDYLSIQDLSDQIITSENSRFAPDLGVGVWYQKKGIYTGASVRHLLVPLLVSNEKSGEEIRVRQHYYFVSAINVVINSYVNWKPSVLFKNTAGAKSQIDVSNHLFWNDIAWLGASYRTNEVLGLHAGLVLNSLVKRLLPVFKIGYSYEIAMGQLAGINADAHEVFVSMSFLPRPKLNKLKQQKIIQSPVMF